MNTDTMRPTAQRFVRGGHLFVDDAPGRPYIASESGHLAIEPGTKVRPWPRDSITGNPIDPSRWELPVTTSSGERTCTCIVDAERIELARRGWIDPCVAASEPPPLASADERAALQRQIADAIRQEIGSGDGPHVVARGIKGAPLHPGLPASSQALSQRERTCVFYALAAAAIDDTIADALAQVRQCVVLERDVEPPKARESHAVIVAWICGGATDADVISESPGHTAAEIASIRETVRATLDYCRPRSHFLDNGAETLPPLDPAQCDPIAIAVISGEPDHIVIERMEPEEPITWALELERIAARLRRWVASHV